MAECKAAFLTIEISHKGDAQGVNIVTFCMSSDNAPTPPLIHCAIATNQEAADDRKVLL